jgi:hypothetical protein
MIRSISLIIMLVALGSLALSAAQAEEPLQPIAGPYRVMLPLLITRNTPAAAPGAPASAATRAEVDAAFAVFATARRQFYGCAAPVVRDSALDTIAQALIAGPIPGLAIRGFGSFHQAAPFPLPSQLWQGCESESFLRADGPMLRAGLALNPATGAWLIVIDR